MSFMSSLAVCFSMRWKQSAPIGLPWCWWVPRPSTFGSARPILRSRPTRPTGTLRSIRRFSPKYRRWSRY